MWVEAAKCNFKLVKVSTDIPKYLYFYVGKYIVGLWINGVFYPDPQQFTDKKILKIQLLKEI